MENTKNIKIDDAVIITVDGTESSGVVVDIREESGEKLYIVETIHGVDEFDESELEERLWGDVMESNRANERFNDIENLIME